MTFKARISPYAQTYIRARAEDLLTDTCRITSVTEAILNRFTNEYSNPSGLVIYEGPCRLWEIATSMTVTVGEEQLGIGTTMLSLPWDIDPVPQPTHLVEILTSQDQDLIGRTGVLGKPARGGNLRATRKFVLQTDDSAKVEW